MRTRPWLLTLGGMTLALAAGACDGSSDSPGVTVGDASRPTSGGGGTGGSRDGGVLPIGGSGGSLPGGGTRDAAPPPPPATINPMVKQLVSGRARLAGTGISSCSHQVPSSDPNGDRWCAFYQQGRLLTQTELWVINVTKAMAGTVKCDSANPDADPNCKRLTPNLWTGRPDGGPLHPYSHRFDGDTLIFHAGVVASRSSELYKGQIFAWRPGWREPKQISTNAGITCSGHLRAAVASCLDNITPENSDPVRFDLRAGALKGEPGVSSELPKVDTITPLRSNNVTKWRSGFSRNGEWYFYSTGRTATDRETLYAYRVAELGDEQKRIEIGNDITRWQISADSTKIYYLKTFNYSSEGDPKGTLVMMDFPMGGNAVDLATNVGAYIVLSDQEVDKGLGLFTDVGLGKGTFRIMKDRTKPMEVQEVIRGISSAALSRDMRYTFYAKEFHDEDDTSDAHVARNDGSGSCTLQSSPTTDQFGSAFNDTAGLVFWADKIDFETGVGEGWVGSPDTCMNKRRFSMGIDFWYMVPGQGMIYSDEGDGERATLRWARFGNEGKELMTAPEHVQRQISRVFSLLLPNYDAAIFMLENTGVADRNGIYGFRAFPWSAAAPTDAGAPAPTPAADAGAPADAM